MPLNTTKVTFVGFIKEGTIRSRVKTLFPGKKIVWTDPIGKYILGGAPAVVAFFAVINAHDGFFNDKLKMRPLDMQGVSSLAQMVRSIAFRYLKQGWHVSV